MSRNVGYTAALLLVAVFANAEKPQPSLVGRATLHGSPLPGAVVDLRLGTESFKASADANGTFRIDGLPTGDATVTVKLGEIQNSTRRYRSVSRRVAVYGLTDLGTIDLAPGNATVKGMLTIDGAPARNGYAMLVGSDDRHVEFCICVLTDERGEYRLDGVPPGNHTLYLDPRESSVAIAVPNMRNDSPRFPVHLDADQIVVMNHELVLGDIVMRVRGLRAHEVARLVVVPGEFSGRVLTESGARMLMNRASLMRTVERDGLETARNLPAGPYAVFFAAFDRETGSLATAFRTMRVTYRNVRVGSGTESFIELEL